MKREGGGILIAALLIVISAIFLVSAAAPATATTVEISDASASPGGTTTTTVTAYDVENLGNFGITITFDPDVMNVTGITGGADVGVFSWKRTADDQVRFFTLNLGLTEPIPSLTGDVLLATLTLHAVGSAGDTSPLDLEIGLLMDHDSNPITATPVSGTFTILTPPTLASIEVAPTTATLYIGDTQQFTATAYDQYGVEMPDIIFTWASSDENVGTIDAAAGLFTALVPGTTVVTATNGTVSGTAEVTVTYVPELTTIEVSPETVTLNVTETFLFTATAYDQYGAEMPGIVFTWMSSNPTVGTIDAATGLFTALVPGTTVVTAINETTTVNGTAIVNVTLPKTGDMNGDGEVNFDDVIALAEHCYFGDTVYADPDVTSDGEVNFDDVILLAKHCYFADPIYP